MSYVKSHPWLTFRLDLNSVPGELWLLLGEIISKAEHIAHAPITPQVADELYVVYLTKGIHATTQIEGNTLTEEQVRQRVDNALTLPESLEYQGVEIDNILQALNMLFEECNAGEMKPANQERIEEFNAMILNGQPLEEGVVPGEFREKSVVVGNVYRGAPSENLAELMDKFDKFINQDLVVDAGVYKKPLLVLRAIIAHLYLAWIHPFYDGNGRTARLIETQLLMEAGFPAPACHLLSDHYNKTRARYYQMLKQASQGDLQEGFWGFVKYALVGLRDGLLEQVRYIQAHQMQITWINYVHDIFRSQPTTKAQERKKQLALTLGELKQPVRAKDILSTTRSIDVIREYATAQPRVLSKDLKDLQDLGLVIKQGELYSANRSTIEKLLPPRIV